VSLTPRLYQELVDRCWRRSGTLLYRPNQRGSCCPHYTLRLDSTQFKPTKDQRQAINRFNKYVTGDAYDKEAARLYPRSKQEAKRRHNEFDLVERVHEAERRFLKTPPEPAHDFVVTLEKDTFTQEKYEVYENYQRTVHQEPPEKITPAGFRRFLCDSPLQREIKVGDNGKLMKLGSYHQCYRLDGKLVAIGVLDLLSHCVSAVYFLYHDSIHAHSPGKLGALREIALAREGGYRYWYSGYYIHSCPKMKYKMDYSPQYVLDPETLVWDHVDKDVLALFDTKHYLSLSRERKGLGESDGTGAGGVDVTGRPNPDPNIDMVDETESEADDDAAFLLTSDMPGIPSLAQMREVDMDSVLIRSDYADTLFLASDLVVWRQQDVKDFPSIKSKIAELVAAIGPDLMEDFCLDFRQRRRSSN
jgi:arginine-tRNA-protein transferase